MLEKYTEQKSTADEKQNLFFLAAIPIAWSMSLSELPKPLQKQVFWCGSRKLGKLPECIATGQDIDECRQLRTHPRPGAVFLRALFNSIRHGQHLEKAALIFVIFSQHRGSKFRSLPALSSSCPAPSWPAWAHWTQICLLPPSKPHRPVCLFPFELHTLTNLVNLLSELLYTHGLEGIEH